jgi:hypothetical protein
MRCAPAAAPRLWRTPFAGGLSASRPRRLFLSALRLFSSSIGGRVLDGFGWLSAVYPPRSVSGAISFRVTVFFHGERGGRNGESPRHEATRGARGLGGRLERHLVDVGRYYFVCLVAWGRTVSRWLAIIALVSCFARSSSRS